MSTLVVSNINDGTTTVPATYVTNGSAKAWVNFNGTGTVATRDSFNVSSLTDNGTGLYTNNFSSAMGNANYSVSGNGRVSPGVNTCVYQPTNVGYSTSSITAYAINMQDSPIDSDYTNVSVQGDLA